MLEHLKYRVELGQRDHIILHQQAIVQVLQCVMKPTGLTHLDNNTIIYMSHLLRVSCSMLEIIIFSSFGGNSAIYPCETSFLVEKYWQ